MSAERNSGGQTGNRTKNGMRLRSRLPLPRSFLVLNPLGSFGAASILTSLLFLSGCDQNMENQPKYKPFAKSTFFEDGTSARHPVPGTVARGQIRLSSHLYTGKADGKLVDTFPFPITREILLRGKERFDIYCSVCHGRTGDGQGMVVKRGFKTPPSFHDQRMRDASVGHFFDVITIGFGVMAPYASRVSPHDRWAIVAYIRALQFSQHARLSELPPEDRERLREIPQ